MSSATSSSNWGRDKKKDPEDRSEDTNPGLQGSYLDWDAPHSCTVTAWSQRHSKRPKQRTYGRSTGSSKNSKSRTTNLSSSSASQMGLRSTMAATSTTVGATANEAASTGPERLLQLPTLGRHNKSPVPSEREEDGEGFEISLEELTRQPLSAPAPSSPPQLNRGESRQRIILRDFRDLEDADVALPSSRPPPLPLARSRSFTARPTKKVARDRVSGVALQPFGHVGRSLSVSTGKSKARSVISTVDLTETREALEWDKENKPVRADSSILNLEASSRTEPAPNSKPAPSSSKFPRRPSLLRKRSSEAVISSPEAGEGKMSRPLSPSLPSSFQHRSKVGTLNFDSAPVGMNENGADGGFSSVIADEDVLFAVSLRSYSSSPGARSVANNSVGSSRKRSWNEEAISPSGDMDDASSVGGLGSALSRASSSSMSRSRSRTRMFSPDSATKLLSNAAAAVEVADLLQGYQGTPSLAGGRLEEATNEAIADAIPRSNQLHARRSLSVNDVNRTATFRHQEAGDISEDDSSVDSGRELKSDDSEALMSEDDDVPNEDDCLVGRSENSKEAAVFDVPIAASNDSNSRGGTQDKDDARRILETMPSYEDLKFVLKSLRKDLGGLSRERKGKTAEGWGMLSVVPLSTWPPQRRMAFIQWLRSRELSFQYRCGGYDISYLQTTYERGTRLLQRLESAFYLYKEDQQATLPKNNANDGNARHECPQEDAVLGSDVRFLPQSLPTSIEVVPISFKFGEPKAANTPKSTISALSAFESATTEISVTSDFASLALAGHDESPPGKVDASMRLNVGFPQVDSGRPKMETLDEDGDLTSAVSNHVRRRLRVDTSLSPIENNSVRHRKDSAASGHQGHESRPSVGSDDGTGGDFMKHLYGTTPTNGNVLVPPTGSLLRHPLSSTRPPSCQSPFGVKVSSINYPPPGTTVTTPFGGRCRDRSASLASALHPPSIETPMPKQSILYGRPTPGKDWGISERCDGEIIEMLLTRLDGALCAAGLCQENSPFISRRGSLNRNAYDQPFDPTEAKRELIAANLGFDFEANENEDDDESTVILDEIENHDLVDEDTAESQVPVKEEIDRNAQRSHTSRDPSPAKNFNRRQQSLAVHKRVSLCVNALEGRLPTSAKAPLGFGQLSRWSQGARRFSRLAPPATLSPIGATPKRTIQTASCVDECLSDRSSLLAVLSHLDQKELLCTASLVSSFWADVSAVALSALVLESFERSSEDVGNEDVDCDSKEKTSEETSIALPMEKSWTKLMELFPWATFLSEGAFKRVYRVWNSSLQAEEAISIMDIGLIESSGNKSVIGAELSVSMLLSSLVRRQICPNFVLTRGVFTCAFSAPSSHWGSSQKKAPKGSKYDPSMSCRNGRESIPQADERGRYQYIRMELCIHGDAEDFIRDQPEQVLHSDEARNLLFQMAFALHCAGDKFGLKHYDVKLLNFFLQDAHTAPINETDNPYTMLRYGVGAHIFNLRMRSSRALIAKLADYGTANTLADSTGKPVTIAQFTTLENTPPDYLILGDAAEQGHGHDCFALGLCMLHLFTGHAPYEELMEDVVCPLNLKKKLKRIWESSSSEGYSVLRSVILADVYEDSDGHMYGEADEVLYDTLYRFLVLFGIPDEKFSIKQGGRVWRAITSCLDSNDETDQLKVSSRPTRSRTVAQRTLQSGGPDASQFREDRKRFSLLQGDDSRIANARKKLQMMEGGMELLMALACFNPRNRATPLDVINSTFMSSLQEGDGGRSPPRRHGNDIAYSFMAYSCNS